MTLGPVCDDDYSNSRGSLENGPVEGGVFRRRLYALHQGFCAARAGRVLDRSVVGTAQVPVVQVPSLRCPISNEEGSAVAGRERRASPVYPIACRTTGPPLLS